MRGDGCHQLISGRRNREPIPVRLGADHSGAECELEQPIGGPHVVTRGRGELEPIEPISENGKPAENLGHLGAQPEDRLLINWSRVAPGQRDDLEARSGHGAQPLGDDDGQAVPAGQPCHVINEDQGFAISEVKVVEQQHQHPSAPPR